MASDAKRREGAAVRNRDNQLLIVLSLLIGVIVGLTVVAFILLTGRLAARMYPPDNGAESAAWRRVLVPLAGALTGGILLVRYFPDARGSGIPQTKFALFIRDGYISLRTVVGKFICCSITLAS